MKGRIRIGASMAVLAWGMPTVATAQTGIGTAQDLPKPTTASDQNANPAVPQPSV